MRFLRYDCLIFDDTSYVKHDSDEMKVLLTHLAQRPEQRSVTIVTNLVFS